MSICETDDIAHNLRKHLEFDGNKRMSCFETEILPKRSWDGGADVIKSNAQTKTQMEYCHRVFLFGTWLHCSGTQTLTSSLQGMRIKCTI